MTEINAKKFTRKKKNIYFKNFWERFSMECHKNNKPGSHSGQSKHSVIS